MSNLATIKDCLMYANFIDKKISESTLRRLISNDEIDYIKENKNLYIDKKSFINYLENKKRKNKENLKEIKKQIITEEPINHKLLISIDWLQVTFYANKKSYFLEKELKSIFTSLLFIKETDITYHDKGYNSYQKMLEYSGIFLMYGDKTYNHCHLQIKGEGCAILYKRLIENSESWYIFFKKLKTYKGKITRLDISIDDYKPIFELEELETKIINREIKTKFKGFKYIKDDKLNKDLGMTIYLGSNTSEIYFRFYKKGIEREEKTGTKSIQFNRYEIVLKDKKANSIFNKIIKGELLEVIAISLINKNFSVYENKELSIYWSKWQELVLGSQKITFDIPKEEKTIERKKSWLKSQVATVIEEVRLADEEAKKLNLLSKEYDTLEDILSYSKYKNNDKDKEKIKEYIEKKQQIQQRI